MLARVFPERESPALPATSPKLLSRQGTRPVSPAPESSETLYAGVSPNVSRKVTTPAVTARITVTTPVILILFLVNCGKTGVIMGSIAIGFGSWHSQYSNRLNCLQRCKHEP